MQQTLAAVTYPANAQQQHGETMPRTIKLYRIESDGRRLAAGAIRANSQDDLAAHWQLFLATAAQGLYVVSLGTDWGMGPVRATAPRSEGRPVRGPSKPGAHRPWVPLWRVSRPTGWRRSRQPAWGQCLVPREAATRRDRHKALEEPEAASGAGSSSPCAVLPNRHSSGSLRVLVLAVAVSKKPYQHATNIGGPWASWPGSPGADGNGAGAPRMHSMMHLCLVRYTPIFCRPYTRGADRQPCAQDRTLAGEHEKSVSYAEQSQERLGSERR